MKEKIKWIDTAKGIGIILVLIGHRPLDGFYNFYIFSFHMPLFFFLSGYLFSIEKESSFILFVKKRFKSLILPYFYFSIISIASFLIIGKTGGSKYSIDSLKIFKTFIISTRNQVFFNQALWYLTSLFLVVIIFFFLRKYIKRDSLLFAVLVTIGIVNYRFIDGNPKLPWSLDESCHYLIFYAVGSFLRKYQINFKSFSFKVIAFFAVLVNLNLLFFTEATRLFISTYIGLQGYSFSIIISLCGIITVLFVSHLAINSRVLNYLGKNSLIIFALHLPIGFTITLKVFYLLGIEIGNINISSLLFTIITLLVLVPFVYIINTFFPFIIGRRREKWLKRNFRQLFVKTPFRL